ncbi:mitochondrial calcium uniporter regulator 1 [Pithys albifrons albifrons]|uniref:mitochondrial calcium uniporter regulator 1 n=1 Tax=Pithys albifrons albifrons TaxID=3385563 RepID=UPI003A5CE73C
MAGGGQAAVSGGRRALLLPLLPMVPLPLPPRRAPRGRRAPPGPALRGLGGWRGPPAAPVWGGSGGNGPACGGNDPACGGNGPACGGNGSVCGGNGPACGGNGSVCGGNGSVCGGNGSVCGGNGPACGGNGPVSGGNGPVSGGNGPVWGRSGPVWDRSVSMWSGISAGNRRHRGQRGVSISASSSLQSKGNTSLLGNRRLFFDTHALVCLLEENGFTTQQSEVIVSALVKIMNTNLDMIYKDMVTKVQQEIALQQVMSHIGGVKKDMIILEKSEFSALRSENEKIKLELQQIKKQLMDEITKVRADNKLHLNLEKSRVKELYSLNERKLLEMRTEIVELHAQQDRALTQTDRKIDTEVADLKTMLESHKLDNIKYLAGSVFTCLTVALGFYRLWI